MFTITKSAARRIEAEQWLADHAAELATDLPDEPAIAFEAAESDTDGRITPEDLDHAAWLASRSAAEFTIEDRLNDPDLPGWGTVFDPEDCQWGFTTHRSPHTLPGAVSRTL